MLAPLTAVCLAAAAHAYQIPEKVLYAILAVEAGRVGVVVPNRNGTHDLGPFQINTTWGPAIGRLWSMSVDDALARVRDDGCANAVIAAAILDQCATEAGGDFFRAVGLYHSRKANLAGPYREKVLAALQLLNSRDKRSRE
jgi:hypothetical protein